MVAGAIAGVTEHTAMYPVDTIKTRMQALSHPGQRVSWEDGGAAAVLASSSGSQSQAAADHSTVAAATDTDTCDTHSP